MIFTDTLTDKALADLVRGIQANGFTSFATQPTGQAGEGNILVYHAAFANPVNGGWMLREITALPTANGYQMQEKTLVGPISFFDALHMAASKFHTRIQTGNSVHGDAATKAALGCEQLADFTDVAVQSGQPLDHMGLPVPAAGGFTLVDGIYDEAAMKTARSTLGRAMTPAGRYQAAASDIISGYEFSVQPGKAEFSPRLIAKFSKALACKKHTISGIDSAVHNGRNNTMLFAPLDLRDRGTVTGIGAFGGFILGVLGAGASYLLGASLPLEAFGACVAFGTASMNYLVSFHSDLARLRFRTHALPAGPQKDMMREFLPKAEGVYLLEHAAFLHAKYRKNPSNAQLLEKALRKARKGLKKMNATEEQTAMVLANLENGTFPASGHFLGILQKFSAQWTAPGQKLAAKPAALAFTA